MVTLNMSCLLPHEFINCLSHDIDFEYLDDFIFCWIDDIFNFLKDVHEFEYHIWLVFKKLQTIKFDGKKSNVKFTKANLIFYGFLLLSFIICNVQCFLEFKIFYLSLRINCCKFFNFFSWSHHKRQVSFATKD